MIFPTESLLELRSQLEDRVTNGELSEAEAYREALAADPEDPRALRLLALLAEDQGDFAQADRLAWQWLRADPLSHEAFRLIGRLLARDPAQASRAAAYTALGNQKLHYDPDAEPAPAVEPSGEEPAEVTREMEPHRLLHSLWTTGPDAVERSVVDQVLARGADMVPLLLGVLNLYAEDLLEEVDDALVARAIPLIGEIGETAALPALGSFIPLEDEILSTIGTWAFQRIASRRPAETLEFIRKAIADANVIELGSFAQQLSMVPDVPGRKETLLSMATRLPTFQREERGAIVLSMMIGAYIMEGPHSELAAQIDRQYGADILSGMRRELKEVKREITEHGGQLTTEDSVPIYDLVCTAFEPVEEDEDEDGESSPRTKIGRNDLCWCGSGKKYKKCHLDSDEGR